MIPFAITIAVILFCKFMAGLSKPDSGYKDSKYNECYREEIWKEKIKIDNLKN